MKKQNRAKPRFDAQRRSKKKFILGVTGSFGSGKTTVAGLFKLYGAKIIDADKIARRLLSAENSIYKKVISVLGEKILKKNAGIDRGKLGQIVFNDKKALSDLNRIMHPAVVRVIKDKIKASKARVIVLDIPLLIEAGLNNLADKLLVVNISRKKQIERVAKRTSLGRQDILKRINCQFPLRYKVDLADFVIDNSKTVEDTKKQVRKIWEEIEGGKPWKN